MNTKISQFLHSSGSESPHAGPCFFDPWSDGPQCGLWTELGSRVIEFLA